MYVVVVHTNPSPFWVSILVLAVFLGVVLAIGYLLSRRHNSDFSFTVGQSEQHEVRYRRSNWSGRMRIAVDGKIEVKKLEMLGFPLAKEYQLRTGTIEVHDVTIVKTRPLILAGFRKQPVQAFVDGNLVVSQS
jgi:hypothetical protein